MKLKKVRVVFESIVEEWQIKDETEILEDYDSYHDAVACDGLDAIINGSYDYQAYCKISDVK